jgi:hypothetical protein
LGRFGSMITCNNEFWGRTNSAGVGYITTKTLTNCSSPVSPCAEAVGEDVWPSQLNSETSQEAIFCVIAFGFQNDCTIENLSVSESAGHVGTIATAGGANHVDCDEVNGVTLAGSWTTETGGAGEVEAEIVD